MNWKDFFKLNWTIFILFIIFHLLGLYGFLELSGLLGKSIGAGIFNIFSFFNQFTCSTQWTVVCVVWDPLLKFSVAILNIIWQFFLANLVVIIYHKIKK